MGEKISVKGFGLIIIGTEILDGRAVDQHFENTKRILTAYNHSIGYSMILSDDPVLITDQLGWAMSRDEPFFSFGGIGSTPDDYTRQCAAAAAGAPLELHEEGAKILEERFGSRINESRMRMVEFPRGARLIPNPVNQVPGFSINNGHFLPGFPNMAEPMTAWVLDNYYRKGEERTGRTLILPGAKEADLVPLMEEFIEAHPRLSFSSLPKFIGKGTEVHLGIQGGPEDVERGYRDLAARLRVMGQDWIERSEKGGE